ncbi:MAG: S9 family peptidase [Bacteroidota bacterium]
MKKYFSILCLLLAISFQPIIAQEGNAQLFEPIDVFQLEYASDIRISPDGSKIIYVRNFKDIMTDKSLANLWMINFDGTENRPVTTGNHRDYSPRWSPDGEKLLYMSSRDGKPQVYLRWLDTGAEAKLTNLTQSPSGLSWSPDGKWIAMTMNVPAKPKTFGKMPKKPSGAKWADAPKVIDKLNYRRDGGGFVKHQYRQIFVLSAEGGTPRQITTGDFNHGGTPQWRKDGKALYFSANRHEDGEYDPRNSEVYMATIIDGQITQLTSRQGPDSSPIISPDGKMIAYTGFDDKYQGYQMTRLYVMNADGSESREVKTNLDRQVAGIQWAGDSKGIFFRFDDKGETYLAHTDLNGKYERLTDNLGGLAMGRPYAGSSFSVSGNGKYAFTHGNWDHLADVGVGQKGGTKANRLTRLNDDLFSYKKLGNVEEIWYKSSYDQRDIQGWICYPPDFDPSKKYPLILEIHGGPFANYGDRFSAEVQLFAAAGNVVLYTNPRGSSSYGEEFGNLIHHNYPNQDYDDLMSGVDAIIEKGFIDEENLFVTGGSGGGVLTAWIVGKTDRFQAAVVAKPVINWYSFVLHADNVNFYYKYWFPGMPWDHTEHYMKRSPISLVGNVTTPTMLLTGEQDYRTPMSETEQFYAGLKLNKVETAMVRIQNASHGIASRPSNLIAKVTYILAWFDKYKKEKE